MPLESIFILVAKALSESLINNFDFMSKYVFEPEKSQLNPAAAVPFDSENPVVPVAVVVFTIFPPATSSLPAILVVPIPTFPLESMRRRSTAFVPPDVKLGDVPIANANDVATPSLNPDINAHSVVCPAFLHVILFPLLEVLLEFSRRSVSSIDDAPLVAI